jgi:hypothetical protein
MDVHDFRTTAPNWLIFIIIRFRVFSFRRFRVFLFSSTKFIVIRKCHLWDVKISVDILVTQTEFIIFETMRLKKSVGSVWRQTECEFFKRDLLRLRKNPYRRFQARGDKTGDQTYQLPMNVWRLDVIQQSITLEINRSILEQWTKFSNIAVL